MMATQENTPTGAEKRPPCEMGSDTDNACWREATEMAFETQYGGLAVCAEHNRQIELGQEADEHLTALYKMQEWIAAGVDSEEETILQRHAYDMREKAAAEFWPLAVAQKAAGLIANQPEGETPLTQEQAERLAELMLRCDALVDARVMLEDAPEEMFGPRSRWEMIAALQKLAERERGEYATYKAELRYHLHPELREG